MNQNCLLRVDNLKKHYPVTTGLWSKQVGFVRAVDGVSFDIQEGQTLGLVGESGCGKSTLGRTIIRLEEPTDGRVIYQGRDVTAMNRNDLRTWRRQAQMIFQDPQAALDPRMTAGDSVGEALSICGQADDAERLENIAGLLRTVGLDPDTAASYPHELSGGQKQRIGIARALALKPRIIIADEPVSALDVSIQAQILNLMVDLQEQLGLAYLFVAHDLSVIRHLSHRVAVMYLGKIVELADKGELFEKPLHPYTVALLSDVTSIRGQKKEHILLPGDMPSPLRLPPGCRFNTRCNRRMPVCTEKEPPLEEVGPDHSVACHLYD